MWLLVSVWVRVVCACGGWRVVGCLCVVCLCARLTRRMFAGLLLCLYECVCSFGRLVVRVFVYVIVCLCACVVVRVYARVCLYM